MTTIPRLCGVAILSMAVVSCGGGADDNETMPNEAAPPAVAAPVGTAGEQAASPAPEPAPPAGDLPATASPTPLVGGLGVLLVGGGILLRRYVHRD
jgi:hypothetical protein